ncbi:SDR family oxidoreductase [Chengkuizengella sp. SCS-71B]|uniref:SDR family oxidoreductase n=1 Tax=Chengkuizengella sp. SCS-71B TaxID=3115290 RepID=UPI0032C23EEA
MLKNKVALVTGSAKGLGKKTALALAELGCNVIINYVHSKDEAEHLLETIEGMGVQSTAIKADVTQFDQLQSMIHKIEEQFGGVDILVNNAGPFIRERKLFSDYSFEEMNYLVQGNFLSVMQLDHLVLPHMRRNKWGRIIHFGFGHAGESRGWPHRAVYAAAKVGLVSFTKTLSVEEAEYGITVNMVCPGDIRGQNKEIEIKDVITILDEESPRGRPGTGEDVSRVITFLCQPQSDFVTGNIIDISGGLDPIRTFPMMK